jgi:hypothetical protein
MVTLDDITIGMEVPPVKKIAYQRALDIGDFREDSSHKDNYAQTKGYPAALLSGYILCGYISEFLVNFFGAGWLKSGQVSLAFVKAVHQNYEITISGTVKEKKAVRGGAKVAIDFWLESAGGTRHVIGEASGTMKSRRGLSVSPPVVE